MTTSNNTPTKKRILCVEDEVSMGKMFKELLENEGYKVDNAYDGEEGLRMILTDKYDLITLDHVMPKMMGHEVLEKLRGVKLKGKIGMLTNITSDKFIQHAINHGINFYMVTTNYTPELFVKEINHYINSVGSYQCPAKPKKVNLNEKDKGDSLVDDRAKLTKTDKPQKILIVEDCAELAKVISETLTQKGYSVDTASDGKVGLDRILTDKYDLVCLNVLLPKLTGLAILDKLEGVRLKGKVGMLTNLNDDTRIAAALERNVNFYMVKQNYTPDNFAEEVEKLLSEGGSYPNISITSPSTLPNLLKRIVVPGLVVLAGIFAISTLLGLWTSYTIPILILLILFPDKNYQDWACTHILDIENKTLLLMKRVLLQIPEKLHMRLSMVELITTFVVYTSIIIFKHTLVGSLGYFVTYLVIPVAIAVFMKQDKLEDLLNVRIWKNIFIGGIFLSLLP